jgi:C-terminal processing protease CtpA/Prc
MQINGEEVTKSLIKSSSSQLNKTSIFTVLRNNQFIEVALKPKEYTFKVALGKVLTQGSKKIGYLRYDSFTGTSVAEFEEAFTTFKNTNIDELVIDMRYNGGGSVAVASTLLENITNAYPGQRQGYLDWNAHYKNRNESFYFTDEPDANDLNMKRVFFLVTKGSASASEVVINALKPYLGDNNVITIGSNTHGKPVGMSGKQYGKNIYFLINFYTKNNNGQTTGFEGISPTCSAVDDISHSMGDTNETMLSTALYYIQNNKCP